MMICFIIISSWLGILESCKNGYERLENRRLRPFERWSDRGSENKFFDPERNKPVVVSSDHGNVPWKRGRQSAIHHDGNRIFNPYEVDINTVSDGIKRTKPWGRPMRRSGDTHGERWPGNKDHFQDMEADHSGLREEGVDKGGD